MGVVVGPRVVVARAILGRHTVPFELVYTRVDTFIDINLGTAHAAVPAKAPAYGR
jgi:hypothetical protein